MASAKAPKPAKTIAGQIIHYLCLFLVTLLLLGGLIFYLNVPGLLRSRIAANESSAVGSLRTVNTAAQQYRDLYPERGFPAALHQMAGPESGANVSADAAGIINRELASGKWRGYIISYKATDANGDGVRESYTINADPESPGQSGQRHFFSDESGVFRFETARPADSKSSPLL